MTKFQYFSNNIEFAKPLGYVDLIRFLKSHQNPKPAIKKIFKKIVECHLSGNMKLKAKLKQNNLFYFTPCVHLDYGRKYSNIISFTGLLVFEFDDIHNAKDLKNHLFEEYKYIIATWLSPSKQGVKAFAQIPIVDSVERFKEHFYALTEIMECYDGFDTCNKNAVLPLFQSYDKDLLYRSNATIFNERKKDLTAFDFKPQPFNFVDIQDKDKKSVYNILRAGIDKITTNGHPQLRSVCLAAGGYVASNYITFDEAEQFLHSLIEHNGYLRKGIKGYKGTATWAINQGTNRQLELTKHGR